MGFEKVSVDFTEIRQMTISHEVEKKTIVTKSKSYPGLLCENCYNNMKKGIYFICVKNIIANKRIKTGKVALINPNYVVNMIKNKQTLNLILKRRFCLVEESIFNKLIKSNL